MRWLRAGWRWLWGSAVLTGCVIEVSDGPDDACADVRCSVDGYCRDGSCFCSSGFLGDPWARHGCQSTRPGRGCTTTCGLNSYCDTGACVCDQGFIAVCGTGDCLALRQLCDGVPDCPNGADEAVSTCAQEVIQTWSLVDGCDDGHDVSWRLWSRDRDWAWPDADSTFVSDGVDWTSFEEIECVQGELVCFGASRGDVTWGVGADGQQWCEDCCFSCSREPIDLGVLGCE